MSLVAENGSEQQLGPVELEITCAYQPSFRLVPRKRGVGKVMAPLVGCSALVEHVV